MKRIPVLAALVSVGLLGIVAFGASSASAGVLCQKQSYPDCKAENVYGVGTKMDFRTSKVTLTDAYGFAWLTCKGSGVVTTITNAGGEWPYFEPAIAINEFPFSECTGPGGGSLPNPVVTGSRTSAITWNPGTGTGEFGISGEVLEFKAPQLGGTCRYDIVGTPTLHGPEEGFPASRLSFDKELAEPVGVNNACKGVKGYVSGTYYRIDSGDPVYVLRNSY